MALGLGSADAFLPHQYATVTPLHDLLDMGTEVGMVVGAVLMVVGVLSRQITPVTEAYRMGYEAGLEDGARGGRSADVVRLPSKRIRTRV